MALFFRGLTFNISGFMPCRTNFCVLFFCLKFVSKPLTILLWNSLSMSPLVNIAWKYGVAAANTFLEKAQNFYMENTRMRYFLHRKLMYEQTCEP